MCVLREILRTSAKRKGFRFPARLAVDRVAFSYKRKGFRFTTRDASRVEKRNPFRFKR